MMQTLAYDLRQNLPQVEKALLTLPQVECNVVHRFGPGVYLREVSMPAGTFAIGHHHNFEHTNVLLKGRLIFAHEDGSTSELEAPYFCVAPPGRKVAYVVEDCVWQNIYATEETDVSKLEAHYLTKSDEYLNREVALAPLDFIADRLDFEDFLVEYGLDRHIVQAQSEDESDAVGLPLGSYSFQIEDSPIAGSGLFATNAVNAGFVLGPARIKDKRTIAGRFTNHSGKPNAEMWYDAKSDTVWLQAIKNIRGRRGGESGDEITVDYRQVLKLHGEILCQQ